MITIKTLAQRSVEHGLFHNVVPFCVERLKLHICQISSALFCTTRAGVNCCSHFQPSCTDSTTESLCPSSGHELTVDELFAALCHYIFQHSPTDQKKSLAFDTLGRHGGLESSQVLRQSRQVSNTVCTRTSFHFGCKKNPKKHVHVEKILNGWCLSCLL